VNAVEKEKRHRQKALLRRCEYLARRRHPYSDEWWTPPAIVKRLGKFDLDPCAGPCSSHARRNNRRANGLTLRWTGRVFLNPPYSNVHDWLERFQAHGNGIVLVNARCETLWYQRLAAGASAILFPKGRISFLGPRRSAKRPPVGSALIAYGAKNAVLLARSGIDGLFVRPWGGRK
jgi:hypothetical protein